MTVAERLVSVREANGYTRKQLADELGKPYPTITKYENGQREPGHEYLVLISQKFGVTVDYLLGIETKKAPTTDGEDLADYLQDLRERPETRALLEASRGMTTEQVEQMAAFAKALRGGG